MLLLLLFSLLTLEVQEKAAVALPSSSCPKSCGDVDIVYPFGIGAGCAMEGFQVNCSKSTEDGRDILVFFDVIPVRSISVLHGQVQVMKHISTMHRRPGKQTSYDYWGTDLFGTPFTYSGKSNLFTVVGVNTIAYMTDNTYVLGCVSQCSSSPKNLAATRDAPCYCQVGLTRDMSNDDVYLGEVRNNTKHYTNRSAAAGSGDGYAVIMDAAAFRFNDATRLNATAFLDEQSKHGGRVPVILNWVVGNKTCDVARKNSDSSYACVSSYSECVDSSNGQGYLCNCTEGYSGNPYLPDGCQDIDECANVPSPCPGHCENTPGSFRCPNGSSSHSRTVLLVVGPSIGAVIVVITITCTYLIRERKKLTSIKQKYFQQHGGMLLLQEMSFKQGTAFSIFTEAELIEATNKFDDKNVLGRGAHGIVYRGTLKDGSLVAVKRCVSSMTSEQQQQKEFGKEMLILSQINHKNVVKLLGCCLEVEVPMLVYEFIPNGTLFHFIHGNDAGAGGRSSIPFATRLRIALESAQALAYLHSWASPPILHGDVKSSNILLDENHVAKVSDFGASIVAPTDESQFVTLVQGTCGYLDPEYMQTCQLTDKSDVYSFGVVLLELLTRRKAFQLHAGGGPDEDDNDERSLSHRFLNAVKDGRLMDVVDDGIKTGDDQTGVEEVAELARQCLEMTGEMRPPMTVVAEKLGRLSKAMMMQQQHPWPWVPPAQQQHVDPEETESRLLGESSVAACSLELLGTGNFSTEKRTMVQGLLESGR